uniref:Uncharacterized protein n=1 Tax=Vespula pensylvanica TaxID=30213 RepID=A0A834UBZ9_VESPE|nr:hypothetical protein H0235_006224 [Vespula pensylvanica]
MAVRGDLEIKSENGRCAVPCRAALQRDTTSCSGRSNSNRSSKSSSSSNSSISSSKSSSSKSSSSSSGSSSSSSSSNSSSVVVVIVADRVATIAAVVAVVVAVVVAESILSANEVIELAIKKEEKKESVCKGARDIVGTFDVIKIHNRQRLEWGMRVKEKDRK